MGDHGQSEPKSAVLSYRFPVPSGSQVSLSNWEQQTGNWTPQTLVAVSLCFPWNLVRSFMNHRVQQQA
jgi:hypothetical protein